MTLNRLALGAVGALTTLTLTGCGALQPGAAVEVGDERITVAEVDRVADEFCAAISPQLEGQAESIPHSFLRGGIAGTLALRSAAEQLADDYGVEADTDQYVQTMTDLRANLAAIPEESRDSVLRVESASAYVEAVQARVGEEVLGGEGEYADFVEAGATELETWLSVNDPEFDPSLNTDIVDGAITTVDNSVSFAVSDVARGGLSEQPDSMAARELPDTQRCGR